MNGCFTGETKGEAGDVFFSIFGGGLFKRRVLCYDYRTNNPEGRNEIARKKDILYYDSDLLSQR